MIYSLCYCIEPAYGPAGSVSESVEEILGVAVSYANEALAHLDDWVNEVEWFDLMGEPADIRSLLKSTDAEQVRDALTQVSDTLKARGDGWLDIVEHDDLFALIAHHDVREWASDSLKEAISQARRTYTEAIAKLSDCWGQPNRL